MAQASAFLLASLCCILCIQVSRASPKPGCSFSNDQCVYSIQLGHQKQCDRIDGKDVNASQSSDGVQMLIAQMSSRLDSLQKQIDLIQATSDNGPSRLSCNVSSPGDATQDAEKARLRQEIESLRQRLESEIKLNRNLLERVTNKTRSLFTCQKALGITNAVDDKDLGFLDVGSNLTWYCDFEDDKCGFTRSQTTVYGSGYVGRFATPVPGNGPQIDHSTGVAGGTILGLNAPAVAKNDYKYRENTESFTLLSSVVHPATSLPHCVMFSYYMAGIDVQDLEFKVFINGMTGDPVLKFHGPRGGRHWQLATVQLNTEYTSHPFQLGFRFTTRAYRKKNKYAYANPGAPLHYLYKQDGSMGVDDLYVYNTSCSGVARNPQGAYQNTINGSTSHYTFHTKARSWQAAYDVCRRESPYSSLVSIQSAEEQQYLVDTIRNDTTLSAVGLKGFYTSGSDRTTESRFVWTDNGDGEVVPTGFWHTGQPNDVGGIQNCLLMQYSADDYRWGDVDCATMHPFICESH